MMEGGPIFFEIHIHVKSRDSSMPLLPILYCIFFTSFAFLSGFLRCLPISFSILVRFPPFWLNFLVVVGQAYRHGIV